MDGIPAVGKRSGGGDTLMKTTMPRQMFTRRWFIGGAAAFGASMLTRAFAVPSDFADRRPGALRLGVISDIHIASSLKDGRVLALMPDRVAAALRFFRNRAVDAVAICGDLASFGTKAELMELARVWNETFPNGRRPDGAPVEKLFIMGNHDWEGWTYNKFAETFVPPERMTADVLRKNIPGIWRAVFDEDFEQFRVKNVKGYDFVLAHWMGDPNVRRNCHGRNEDCLPGIREFYAKRTFDPNRPFFHLQHPMPKGTCFAPFGWGQDTGDSVAALSAFPNAIALSGHSHYSLADERAIWQGAFTSVSCGTLASPSRAPLCAGLSAPDADEAFAYENSRRKGAKTDMPLVEGNGAGTCGLLIDVTASETRLTRLELPRGAVLGPDWVLPSPAVEGRPFAYAERAKKSVAPEFPAGAVATATLKDADGKRLVAIRFPRAAAAARSRVYDYEIMIVAPDGKRIVRRVLAPGYNLASDHSVAKVEPHCELAVDRIPEIARCRVEIRPRECFGRAGSPLVCVCGRPV